jgi:ABC-type transport system involved in multi-copper enzyme maturation permease subunit
MSARAEPIPPPGIARPLSRGRLVLAVIALAGLGILAFARGFIGPTFPWQDGALLGLMMAAVIFFVRPLLPPLFGPILVYDLVSTARRGRYVIVRMVYVAALMVMLFILYAEWFGGRDDFLSLSNSETIGRNQVSAFNDSFFQMFMAVQYLVVVLLTPGITAGAVAEEKERRTLEHLLATDLHNHEIIFGKLAARLAYLALILLTGLPVLSLLELLGGVDPQMLLAGFVATGVTMLSLAALSIFNSVYATKPRTAIALTYAQAACYFIVTTGGLWLWDAGRMPAWAEWACSGNAYVALENLRATILAGPTAGKTLVSGLPVILLRYVLFHLAVTVLCLIGSLVGLRLWARWQASGRRRKAYVIALTQRRLPRVSARPMMWKELHAEPLIRLGQAAQIIITTGVALGLLFCAFVLLSVVVVGLVLGDIPGKMNTTVRLMGTALASLMVLGAALRAAGAISGERDRQTMDALLTTPIENASIVWAKWWGSVLGVRKAGYGLLLLWIVGAATGGLSVLALPLLAVALFAYLGFAASLGLGFSLRCRTTLRATTWTVVTLIGVSFGHLLLTEFCCGPLMRVPAPPPGRSRPLAPGEHYYTIAPWAQVVSEVQLYALTPPVTMLKLAFSDEDTYLPSHNEGEPFETTSLRRLAFSLLGIVLYGLAAIVLLLRTAAQFTAVTGRLPLPGARPNRVPPRKRAVSRG